MTEFRLDVSRETGAATLWMAADTPCGFKPILEWTHVDGVRQFAEMLLDICNRRMTDHEGVGGTSPQANRPRFS